MALIKRRDLLADNPLAGSPRAAVHERDRYNARQTVFPTGSPRASGQRERPKKLSSKAADRNLQLLNRKVAPLLSMRDKANKVYGETYFENHYPVADKDLKTAIDKMVMNAHSRFRAKQNEEEDEPKAVAAPSAQPITVVINIGEMK